jgi:Domain of unknown function (DUF5076)
VGHIPIPRIRTYPSSVTKTSNIYNIRFPGGLNFSRQLLVSDFGTEGNMNAADSQLRVPDGAADDPKTFEIARVLVAHGGQHVTLRVDVWKKPAAWAIVSANLARHFVNNYEQEAGLNRGARLEHFKAQFQAEMDSATNTPTGFVI